MLALTIFIVLLANVAVQVRLNIWQRDFYNAIEQRSVPLIGDQILLFAIIAGILLCAVVGQVFAHEMLKIRLRERLTNGLLSLWMAPGKAYRYRMSSPENANPDQRIHEDVRQLSELSADLGIGFLQAALMLISFIAVLWILSAGVVLPIAGYVLSVPGYMVWCALAYAAVGSYVAWRVGYPLMEINSRRYAREADFRFTLVRANESAESIALYRGESDERAHMNGSLRSVLSVARQGAAATARLTWVTSGYGWVGIIFPVLIALPGYMQGNLSLGGLMMVVGAFNQVQVSLKWFVDSFARIADWSAVYARVNEIRRALTPSEPESGPTGGISGIRLLPAEAGAPLILSNVSLYSPCGRVLISKASCTIHSGERLMISGASGLGKSTLFRAMAGIWQWGDGVIHAPQAGVMFLPQRPYLPLGSLRAAVVYPSTSFAFDQCDIEAALIRVGLEELIPSLDLQDRWDQRLSNGQQQRLSFSRVLLHKPQWVFLDEATSALDEANQALAMSIFDMELPDCAVISIAHQQTLEVFHNRILHVVAGDDGARLCEKPRNPSIVLKPRKQLNLGHGINSSPSSALGAPSRLTQVALPPLRPIAAGR
ncbi:MAG: ABC transporter ATP-binding protein/permease, partial [Chitinophagales bacterium]|nr:ABC transporter ATP-binding protein/permease [Hyphomicrobiales bacterium]